MQDKIQVEKCNRDCGLAFQKKIFDQGRLIQDLNGGVEETEERNPGGLHFHKNGKTATLYQVGIVRYQRAMKENKLLKKTQTELKEVRAQMKIDVQYIQRLNEVIDDNISGNKK